MSDRFVFRFLPGDPERVEWLRMDQRGDTAGDPAEGTLQELAEQSKRQPLVLLLPGDDVFLTQVTVPPGNARQLANAVPFAVEEQLAEDVESLYIVHGRREGDGTLPVAVAHREWLDNLLRRTEEAGARPVWAIPESLSLPLEKDSWSLLEEEDRIVLRYGVHSGLVMERETAVPIVSRLIQERRDEKPQVIKIWCRQEEGSDLQELFKSNGYDIEVEILLNSSLSLLKSIPEKRPPLDLLRKVQRDTGGAPSGRRTWQAAAALLVSAFLVYLGSTGYQYRQLHLEKERLNHEIDSVFREAFSQVRRVVDPIVQGEQELRKRRRAHGRGGDLFLSMLYQFGQALKKQNPTKLTGLDFRNGVMQAQLEGKNVSQIEALARLVEKKGGFETEILSAVSREKGVAAKLRISKDAP